VTITLEQFYNSVLEWFVFDSERLGQSGLHCFGSIYPGFSIDQRTPQYPKRIPRNMSLVGSEVDISIDTDGGTFSKTPIVSDDELSLPDNPNEEVDYHPPPSPPRAAEQLFLSNLETQNISAAALAQQIHQSLKSPSFRYGTSVATDDFVTAVGSLSPADCEDVEDGFDFPDTPAPISASTTYNSDFSPADDDDSDKVFEKDALSRNYRYVINPEEELEFQDANMSTVKSYKQATVGVATPPKEKKFFPTEAPAHVDAAEKVYDTAKGVWAWGKGVMVVSTFLGLAEGVAGKAAQVTGNSLEGLDGEVVKQLHGIDDKVLNPAIEKIVGILLGAAGKSEDILKPVIIALLKPFGLIKDSAENPEQTPVAGVTSQVSY